MNALRQDIQHDAHVKAHETQLRIDAMSASRERTSLLRSTGWMAAERFTDETLCYQGVSYFRDTDHGRITALIQLVRPHDKDTNFSTLYPDIPAEYNILVFQIRCPITRDSESSWIDAILRVAPLGDDRFRILSFGVSDNTVPLPLQFALVKDMAEGMDDFMTRVATRRGKVCTVVDAVDIPAFADVLISAGYRIRKPAPGEDRGYARVDRDREILAAVRTLTRHGVQASVPHIGGEATDLFPVERLKRRDNGQPYTIELEKSFHPLKEDTREALLGSHLDASWGIAF